MIDKDYYKPKVSKSGYNKNYVQYESKGDKILTLKEYLNLTNLKELIEEYKLKGEWKVQLTIEVNFISLKPGSDETGIMYTRSDNVEIMFRDDNDDISSVKWGLLTRSRSGFFKFLTTLKTIKNH